MLARKAEYMQESKENYSMAVDKIKGMNHQFSKMVLRTLFLGVLLGGFLLGYVHLTAVQSNFNHELIQEEEKIQQLQQENDSLRIDVAKLESPERIHTIATSQLGMIIPTHVLYAQSKTHHAAAKSR